jgi:hypothetical protein
VAAVVGYGWGLPDECAGRRQAAIPPAVDAALLIYSYASGIFASRRIERASCRDVGMRFVAANTHPDHDTIATFRWPTGMHSMRRSWRCCYWRASGLLRLGTVSIGGTKIDANASKILSLGALRPRTGAAQHVGNCFDHPEGLPSVRE